MSGVFPPLAASDYIKASPKRVPIFKKLRCMEKILKEESKNQFVTSF